MSSVKQKRTGKVPQKSTIQSPKSPKSIVLDRDILGKMARQIKEKLNAHDGHADGPRPSAVESGSRPRPNATYVRTPASIEFSCRRSRPSPTSSSSVNPTVKSQEQVQPQNIPFASFDIQSDKIVPEPMNSLLNVNNQTVARMASCLREKLRANAFSDPFTSANCVDSTAITIPSPVPLVTKPWPDMISELPILTYQRYGRRNTYLRPTSVNSEDDIEDSDDYSGLSEAKTRPTENCVESLSQAPQLSVGLPATSTKRKGKSGTRPVISKTKQNKVSPVKVIVSVKRSGSVKPGRKSRVIKPQVQGVPVPVSIRQTRSSRKC